jgi:hypothetical protein
MIVVMSGLDPAGEDSEQSLSLPVEARPTRHRRGSLDGEVHHGAASEAVPRSSEPICKRVRLPRFLTERARVRIHDQDSNPAAASVGAVPQK